MALIRLAPSGPPFLNANGGGLDFGPGARLRLTEAVSTMGGSSAIPTVPDNGSLICPDGFGNADAVTLTLLAPKQGLEYRANLSLDIVNNSTNAEGEVVLYLDVSIDGGATYTNRAKNAHVIPPLNINPGGGQVTARAVQVWLPLTTGQALGVNDATPTPSIKLRARAQSVLLPPGNSVQVHSLATSDGSAPPAAVTGLNGTIHMELEECF